MSPHMCDQNYEDSPERASDKRVLWVAWATSRVPPSHCHSGKRRHSFWARAFQSLQEESSEASQLPLRDVIHTVQTTCLIWASREKLAALSRNATGDWELQIEQAQPNRGRPGLRGRVKPCMQDVIGILFRSVWWRREVEWLQLLSNPPVSFFAGIPVWGGVKGKFVAPRFRQVL